MTAPTHSASHTSSSGGAGPATSRATSFGGALVAWSRLVSGGTRSDDGCGSALWPFGARRADACPSGHVRTSLGKPSMRFQAADGQARSLVYGRPGRRFGGSFRSGRRFRRAGLQRSGGRPSASCTSFVVKV
jgi:hypothetical protein